ncbi:MAG: TMEM165/GDT1 family protein [Euryarchaeota archaeon]|nr:TMEM165/GDT1 family protein [Euryarchaeota archaeon]
MLQDLLVPMAVVGLAELGDKTQIAIFLLSTKTKEHIKLLSGAILAFLLADGLAVAAGGYVNRVMPIDTLKLVSGLIFILFGVITLMSNRKEERTFEFTRPFYSGFTVIFISELGDKTQIASVLFAARYNPLFVFVGVMMTLSLLSIMALYLGKVIATKVNEKLLSTVGGFAFIVVGVAVLVG